MNISDIKQNFLTLPECVEFLSLSKTTVFAMCRDKRLIGAEKISGRWFIPRDSAMAYKVAHTRHKKQNAEARKAKKRAKI